MIARALTAKTAERAWMALVRLHATLRQGTMETFVKRKIV